jgi:putative nucleotidyltransferase with HDIG domain
MGAGSIFREETPDVIPRQAAAAVADPAVINALSAVVAFEVNSLVPALPIVSGRPGVHIVDRPAAPADERRDRLFRELAMVLNQTRTMLDRVGPELAQSGLLTTLETRTPGTYDHAWRVAELTVALGRAMGLSPADVRELRCAALFHDIGKIAIPSRVLEQSGPLDDDEIAVLRLHVTIGAELLAGIPALSAAAPVVAATHERWDGSGYPLGLAGTDIPLGARIIAVADAHDAMTARRPYGAPLSHADATSELARCSGTHFDPDVVRAWTDVVDAPRMTA